MVRLLLTLNSRAAAHHLNFASYGKSLARFFITLNSCPFVAAKQAELLCSLFEENWRRQFIVKNCPKCVVFSSLQHNNALMFLSPQNCPYLMIVRFNNCLDILAYIICGVLLKTAKISSWAWNLVGFFSLLLLLRISFRKKEICLGSMIVKSIGRIFNTPGIQKKNSRESYMIPARNANILMRLWKLTNVMECRELRSDHTLCRYYVDILFCQITMFIKLHLVVVFGLQIL